MRSNHIFSSFLRYQLYIFKKIVICNKRFINSDSIKISDKFKISETYYYKDECTNVTPRIINKINSGLHNNKGNPLGIIMERIRDYFYKNFRKVTGKPLFSIFDNISPVVSVKQNFDDLLIPEDHISRSLSDTYYINRYTLLRSHTSAHEADLIRSGLDAFIVAGDVYRRDEIDFTHYPVFHQVEAVRLFTKYELFNNLLEITNLEGEFLLNQPSLRLHQDKRLFNRQERHGELTAKILENELKGTLENLASHFFGNKINHRWVPAYFPWTYPSFELELEIAPNTWMEMLGCGIIEQDMLDRCGVSDRVGFAFGLGLERWAMKLFDIPDIRLFWSKDDGFLKQFSSKDIHTPIKYKPISLYPPCICDISFWLPDTNIRPFHDNDLYEIVGSIAGDLVERIEILDKYVDKKTGRTSHCYRIVYRHMSQNLTQKEINIVHEKISKAVHSQLSCELR